MLFNWKLFPGTNLQDLNLDWIINFVKMIPSRLPKFSDHHTWLVYDYSTGEYYDSGEPTGGAGEPGEPGKSPIIGTNGNWYVYNNDVGGYVDTGTRAQGVQGEPGAGVASGGVAGDVLVKASGVDYNTGWTATPPQMGSLAYIEQTSTVSKQVGYQPGEYLVYNGQLYKVGSTAISQGQTLNPGSNISAVSIADDIELTGYPFPTSSLSSKLANVSGYVYKKAGIVELYFRATSNAEIAAWEALLTGLPAEYQPFDTNNAFYMIVDNNVILANFNGNGVLNTPITIANDKAIRFKATYLAKN